MTVGGRTRGVRLASMCDQIELAPTPGSVAEARRWSSAFARRSGFAIEVDTLALLVSELVSNVVLHARTTCELGLSVRARRMRVEVRDGSNAMPALGLSSDPMALSGRGMLLIDTLSTAHGSEALPGGGKLVWFELETVASPPS